MAKLRKSVKKSLSKLKKGFNKASTITKKQHKKLKPTLKKFKERSRNIRDNIEDYFDENSRQLKKIARKRGDF